MSFRQPIVVPSILAGCHVRLAESLDFIVQHGASWVHLDIMDGHFVPNLTFGPQTIAELRAHAPASLFFDTHLMLDQPRRFIESFAQAGANLISIHLETDASQLTPTLADIRALGCRNGIVLNPDTPADAVHPFLESVDLVLVMTVQPGFGGQSFRTDCLDKLSLIDDWRRKHSLPFRLEVDGGINRQTGISCRDAGADVLVAGTAFFQDENPAGFLHAFAPEHPPDSSPRNDAEKP